MVAVLPRILLVDDDPLVRASLAEVLSESGYDVAEAMDGSDGLKALERAAFDLVVLDILMPERDGLETIREIRKKWATLPVLAISGGDRTGWCDHLHMAASFGADDTMSKPFLSSDLLVRVGRLVARAKA
jgi:DNA-binding response OmpR family regulator